MHKVNRKKFDASQATEQFEKYKETGKGKIIPLNPNQIGYSSAYAEGWQRIFGSSSAETANEANSEEDADVITLTDMVNSKI